MLHKAWLILIHDASCSRSLSSHQIIIFVWQQIIRFQRHQTKTTIQKWLVSISKSCSEQSAETNRESVCCQEDRGPDEDLSRWSLSCCSRRLSVRTHDAASVSYCSSNQCGSTTVFDFKEEQTASVSGEDVGCLSYIIIQKAETAHFSFLGSARI